MITEEKKTRKRHQYSHISAVPFMASWPNYFMITQMNNYFRWYSKSQAENHVARSCLPVNSGKVLTPNFKVPSFTSISSMVMRDQPYPFTLLTRAIGKELLPNALQQRAQRQGNMFKLGDGHSAYYTNKGAEC